MQPFRKRFFKRLQKILQSTHSNTKNFVIFALIFGLVNFFARITLFAIISPLELDASTASSVAFLVALSSSVSVSIFFAKYYADAIKKKLRGAIDFDKIEKNRTRRAHLEEMIEQRFPDVSFTSAKLLLAFNAVLFGGSARCCGTSLQGVVSACLTLSFIINAVLFYRIHLAFAKTDIPVDRLPLPSKFEEHLGNSRLLMTEWLMDFLFGNNRARTPPLDNERLQQRTLRKKNRYAIVATTGLLIGVAVGAVGYGDFSYTRTGQDSPIGEYLQSRRRGY